MRYRKLHGLKSSGAPLFAQLGDPEGMPLSDILERASIAERDKVFLCGSLAEMSREYVEEPLARGWKFARQYVHKFRSPVYKRELATHPAVDRRISVKLVGESWLPGCESMVEAIPAWQALRVEWGETTGLPLLSTPSKTGQALLWESLPRGVEFPPLPDDLARHIRSISPQHRYENLRPDLELMAAKNIGCELYQYDGRWMYAALAGLDRLPVGEPQRITTNRFSHAFKPYQPGWYHVRATIPLTWEHIGLLPVPDDNSGWRYPNRASERFETWASEPELTVAQSAGWYIDVIEGWQFQQGRPLANWARKLIDLRECLGAPVQFEDRERCAQSRKFAAAAVREILNHTIGSLHANGYEREQFVADADWPEFIRANGWPRYHERVDGGRMAPVIVPDNSPLSIYMPYWSAQIWALERARIAQACLQCDPRVLVKIQGDAIYSTAELPFEDNGNLGQLRRKL